MHVHPPSGSAADELAALLRDPRRVVAELASKVRPVASSQDHVPVPPLGVGVARVAAGGGGWRVVVGGGGVVCDGM